MLPQSFISPITSLDLLFSQMELRILYVSTLNIRSSHVPLWHVEIRPKNRALYLVMIIMRNIT